MAEKVARQAGERLQDAYSLNAGVFSEEGKDIKTEADQAAEAIILEALRPTGITILSEESGLEPLSQKNDTEASEVQELLWVIDPLDGTFNFTRNFPFCCVSIGLLQGNEPIMGVIYDFAGNRMYTGSLKNGAFCNGLPLSVSNVHDRSHAALATGFPSARDYSKDALANSIQMAQRYKKIRMIGSAALSLANVAAGHIDAYHEEDIWLWDVAAGLALLKAAGGDYALSEMKETYQLNVSATNGKLPHFEL